MKYVLFVLFVLLHIPRFSAAQQPRSGTGQIINQNTVVKDENGTVLSYSTWSALLKKGIYGLKRSAKAEAEVYYTLYQLSEEEIEANEGRKQQLIAGMPKPRASETFPEGSKFGKERWIDLQGTKHLLKPDNDKIYVLNFWFIDCPPCRAEMPELNKLVQAYEQNDRVVFLSICLDDASAIRTFLKSNPFFYQIVADGRYIASKYGLRLYPTQVILGRDNTVKFSSVSFASNTLHWMKKVIDEQLKAE